MSNNESKHTPTPEKLGIFLGHIVHCVNTHDTLVEQRDALLAKLEVLKVYEQDCRHSGIGYDAYVADIVEAAIAKVEDKP